MAIVNRGKALAGFAPAGRYELGTAAFGHSALMLSAAPVRVFPIGAGVDAVFNGDENDNGINGTLGDDEINGLGGNDFLSGLDGLDIINGGDGLDTIYGGNDHDELYGGAGDDVIQALGSVVVLTSTGPSDTVDGGSGNDLLALDYEGFIIVGSGTPAAITLDISTGAGEVDVSGLRGENFTRIESINFRGPEGDDTVTGGALADTIYGFGGNDILSGAGGDDVILDTSGFIDADGGSGSGDYFVLSREDTAKTVVDCTTGTITVGGVSMGTFLNFEIFNISTGTGNDKLTGKNGAENTLGGGTGNDELIGKNLDDTLLAGPGNDTATGANGNDHIEGGEGNDTLSGGGGNDIIYTDGGVDAVNGGDGDDIVLLDVKAANATGTELQGGTGIDRLDLHRANFFTIDLTGVTIEGFEILNDFDGQFFLSPYVITMTTEQFKQFTTIQLQSFSDNITIKFADNATVALPATSQFRTLQLANGGQKVDMSGIAVIGRPNILGGTGNDVVIACDTSTCAATLGDGNDKFTGGLSLDSPTGGNGNDRLDGNANNDTLVGNAGKDKLKGGDGVDTLNGGADADKMDSGTGADKFVYAAGAVDSTGGAFDTVSGFDFNAADRFDITIAITGIDTAVNGGSLSKATFNDDLEGAIGNGDLAVAHAVLFNPNGGDYAGKTFLIINVNGQAGYEADADLVILLNGPANIASLDIADFM
jgi:Ca2+-binding RTX toxin-like protein